MTTLVREPGTYRTPAGELIHFRIDRDGGLVVEHESEQTRSGIGVPLVKLSDDPDWPDRSPRLSDPALFAD
jgi:hypothetical protein